MRYRVVDDTPRILPPSHFLQAVRYHNRRPCHPVLTGGQRTSCGSARCADRDGYPPSRPALVAQRIEHAPPKRGMQVRFLPGACRPAVHSLGRTLSATVRPQNRFPVRKLPNGSGIARRSPLAQAPSPCGQLDARTRIGPGAGRRAAARPFGHRRARRAPGPWWRSRPRCWCCPLLVVVWAKTRPGYDPYGWLVWGRQTILGHLDTNAAPSWKPLPYLFTLPYALFGHYQLWLWMVTSVAISLSGVIFAARIAYKLTDAPPERRWAAYVAGAFAGAALLGITDYMHYVLSAQSDPLIASLCLGAVDCHLCKRPRWAFGLLVLASLGRPEVWPFIAAYAIWAWLAGAVDALDGGGGRGRRAGPVVRGPGPDVAQLLPGGQQRARLGARDPRQQGDRHHQPLLRPPRDLAGAAGAAVGRAGGAAPRPSHADPGRRGGGVGDRRDRVRAARLAGGPPVHVPGGGRDGRGRRGRRRAAADPAASAVERCWGWSGSCWWPRR